MQIKKIKAYFPNETEPRVYEQGSKMPHSGASVVIQEMELTPTGGVVVIASSGRITLLSDIPLEMELVPLPTVDTETKQ